MRCVSNVNIHICTHTLNNILIYIFEYVGPERKKTTYKRSNATFQHNKLPSLHTLKIFSRLNKDKHSPHEESKHFLSPTHYFLSMEKQLKISIFCLYRRRSFVSQHYKLPLAHKKNSYAHSLSSVQSLGKEKNL